MNYSCRYNPAHKGPYSNAVVLAKHYAAEHADVYVPPEKKACPMPDCGKYVTDVKDHLRRKHGLTSAPPPKAELAVIEPEPQPRWSADHIVLPVMIEMAGGKKGTIPVAKLGAVFAWREATQQMLDQVQ